MELSTQGKFAQVTNDIATLLGDSASNSGSSFEIGDRDIRDQPHRRGYSGEPADEAVNSNFPTSSSPRDWALSAQSYIEHKNGNDYDGDKEHSDPNGLVIIEARRLDRGVNLRGRRRA